MLKNIAICLLLVGLTACKNDDSKQPKLNGRWELTLGERNGQEAESLERIYFDFTNDKVTTNFNVNAADETVPFTRKDDKLIQNSEEPIEYKIETLSDSILEISTELRGSDFKLHLKKVN